MGNRKLNDVICYLKCFSIVEKCLLVNIKNARIRGSFGLISHP